jgi:hypothetical protein
LKRNLRLPSCWRSTRSSRTTTFGSLASLVDWFKRLSAPDQAKVTELWSLAAENAVFGVLRVLDGVRAIESQSDKGTLELYYVTRNERIILNVETDPLHDIFQGFRSFE